MRVIINNSDTHTSDPIPPYIYSIHQSLIQQNIITHPEIITCSQQWINKLEKDIPNPSKSKRVKRCHYVNHCHICNHLRKQRVLSQMNPYRQILLDNDGRNLLLTFTLRHHQSHSFEFLQKILNESIGLLRTSRTFSKKLFPSKHRLYVLTEYEISWSADNGYSPHCHLQIGTTNPMPLDEIQSLLAEEWRRIIAKVSPTKNVIPSYEKGVDVSDNPSGEHSKDKDPFEMESLKKLQRKSKRMIKERFRKENSYSLIQMQSMISEDTSESSEFLSVLKTIYQKTLKRFRSFFLNLNRRHPLFSQVIQIQK